MANTNMNSQWPFVAIPIINSTIDTKAITANSPFTNLSELNISDIFVGSVIQLNSTT
jgi:hypothetical protein